MRHDECREAVLRGAITSEVRGHLESCVACARLARAMGEVQSSLKQIPPAPAGLPERILERMEREREVQAEHRLRRLSERVRASLHSVLPLSLRTRLALPVVPLLLVVLASLVVWGMITPPVSMAPLTGQCPGGQGEGIEVAGPWTGKEAASFARVLEVFEEETGLDVHYSYANPDLLGPTLRSRLRSGCSPDVALLPQPALLADLARTRELAPIRGVAEDLVDANYSPPWRELGKYGGELYGVPFKAAHKSLIWYSPAALRRAGVRQTPPRTWRELLRVANELSDKGVTPFSVGGADGWTLTDWFENVYLRTAGPEKYEKLRHRRIRWDDQSVREALRRLSDVFKRRDWLAPGAHTTTFEGSVRNVFDKPSQAAMVYEGDFVAGQTSAKVGEDARAFPFPPIDRPEEATVTGGDVAVLFEHANGPAEELIRFLAKPKAAERWARSGGFLSANRKVDPAVYPDPSTRNLADQLLDENRTIVFDLSDSESQPPAFGATAGQGMWEILQDFLRKPENVEGTARDLERAAAAADRCEHAVKGEC